MMPISLNYKVYGEGQPLLILHGLFGSLDNWQTLAKKITEQGYQVFLLDARNHGKSPHTPEMSHQFMAADVAHFIQTHQLEQVTLVGHSMGGKTAMQLALTQAQLIAKLVVVDIAPKPYPAHHNTYFEAMNELPVTELSSRKEADIQLKTKVPNVGIRQFLLKNLTRNGSGFQWKFNLSALEQNYSSLIGGIHHGLFNKPTLFIGGKSSNYISAGDVAPIKSLFPQAEVTYIEDAGHWVHAEQPEAFLNTLINFLDS